MAIDCRVARRLILFHCSVLLQWRVLIIGLEHGRVAAVVLFICAILLGLLGWTSEACSSVAPVLTYTNKTTDANGYEKNETLTAEARN